MSTCKCTKIHSCAVCRPLCFCDEDGACDPCKAKPNPTITQVLDEYGPPPRRAVARLRTLFDKLPIVKACPDCKIVPNEKYNDVQICRGHRALFDAEYVDPSLCDDHEPDSSKGYHCLHCGKDCSEDVMSAAYDRAKDIRKYGA